MSDKNSKEPKKPQKKKDFLDGKIAGKHLDESMPPGPDDDAPSVKGTQPSNCVDGDY